MKFAEKCFITAFAVRGACLGYKLGAHLVDYAKTVSDSYLVAYVISQKAAIPKIGAAVLGEEYSVD